MKRKSILMFLILLFSFIFLMPFAYSDYVYVDDIYQVNESKDDAVYYVGFNYYDDDSFLLITSNLYDVKTGIVFNNISIYDNATFVEAYLSLYSNDSYTDNKDYWVTLYGIDEDNISSFSDFEDFNNKSYTNNKVNWNLEDLEGLDTWVNSSNLANIFNEVKSRSGWSSGNNLGLYILSVKSSDAYRMCLSYDGNSSYAPKLYLKYRYYVPIDGVSDEEEFVKKYRNYDIYKIPEGEGGLDWIPTDYHIVELCVGGLPYYFGGNPHCESIVYSHNRYWFVGWDNTGDLWLWNSTNKIDWYGSELDSDHELEIGNDLWSVHRSLLSTMDSQGDLHIIWFESPGNIYYKKVELESDGTITNYDSDFIITGFYPEDLIVDGQDYPIMLGVYSSDLCIYGSSTKDGTWTMDYFMIVADHPDRTNSQGVLMPMSGNSGKDILIVYRWNYYDFGNLTARYFDEPTETLGNEICVDDERDLRYSKVIWDSFNKPNGLDIIYQNNETFITSYGYDVGEDKVNLVCYRTIDGGISWSKKIIYTVESYASTDYVGHIVKMNENNDLIVYYRHNDINEGNQTFFLSEIENANIPTSFTGTWDDENIELYDRTNVYEDRLEGHLCWSITNSGISEGSAIIFGFDQHGEYGCDCSHILGSTFVEGSEEHFFIYDENGNLIMSCFTELEDAEDYIDEYIKEKQYDNLGNTISWMLGLMGLIMMPLGFVLFVSQAQSGDYRNAFLYLMICFFIGMSLFVGWLWG